MLDLNKPLQTRDGRPAELIAKNVPYAALIRAVTDGFYVQSDDSMLVKVGLAYRAYKVTGRCLRGTECNDDLVNVPEVPVRTSEFRTFAPQREDGGSKLGHMRHDTLDGARTLLSAVDLWEGVLEIIREDGKLVDVKFHSRED